MKKCVILATGLIVSFGLSFTSYAGEWKQNENGYWWQNDDGSYPSNGWQWIDGNNDGKEECYYFNENGYLLSNMTTPDNCQVDENGAWTVNGVLQQRDVEVNAENNVVSDRFVDISKFFNTDLQYFYKAKEILGESEWWFLDDNYIQGLRGNSDNYRVNGRLIPSADGHYIDPHPDIDIDYDGKSDDHRIIRIIADPYVLINGLEKDRKYSVAEIAQIAKESGAKDVQTVNNDTIENYVQLVGISNGATKYIRHSDTVTFWVNGLKYTYDVTDGMIGSYEFWVTRK